MLFFFFFPWSINGIAIDIPLGVAEWAGKQKFRTKIMLLQLEGIEANINTLQMRKLQCGEVKSLAQGQGVSKGWSWG